MKISVLEIIGDPSLAGAPRHLLGILENLDLDKFEIHVICPPGHLAGEIRNLRRQIDLEVIPMRSRLDFEAISKIRHAIKQIKPDLIHVHGTRAGSLGRLAAIGFNLPVIYTEHLWTKQYALSNKLLNFIHYFANWFLDIFTNLNIAVSGAVKEFLTSSGISHDKKIKVIYNGIEPTKTEAKVMDHGEEILIGTVGTLNVTKGVQFLIRALPQVLAEFPQVKLEIVGEGPYRKKLEQLVARYKLSKQIKFKGFIADVEQEMAKWDVYVQPSLSESFGLAIIQAMSVGLPVVASRAGGIPEVVTDGQSGILVEPAKFKDIVLALLILCRDPELARKMGRHGRQEVRARFDLNDSIKELEKTYEHVVQSPAFPE